MSTQKHERNQLHKVTFTSTPKIRRKKTRNRSVRNVCEELVDSFFPTTIVSYNAMKMRLMKRFNRCDRKTVLAYLGRPKRRQVEKIEQVVQYQKSGATTVKNHTFTKRLPAKKGYLEIYELAELHYEPKTGEIWFKLNHTFQSTLPPPSTPHHKSLKECSHVSRTNSLCLNSGSKGVGEKKFLKPKLDVRRTEKERESLSGREFVEKKVKKERKVKLLTKKGKSFLMQDSRVDWAKYMRDYREKFPELKERQKINMSNFKKKNPEYFRKYREANKDKQREYARKWREKNRDKHNAIGKQWAQENPEKVKAENRAYYHMPLEKICAVCGATENLERHHPDYNKPLEIVTLCKTCHTQEHKRKSESNIDGGCRNNLRKSVKLKP